MKRFYLKSAYFRSYNLFISKKGLHFHALQNSDQTFWVSQLEILGTYQELPPLSSVLDNYIAVSWSSAKTYSRAIVLKKSDDIKRTDVISLECTVIIRSFTRDVHHRFDISS